MIVGYVLFFLLGLTFGYAIESQVAFVVLLIPVLLAVGAILFEGFAGVVLVRLVVALAVTVVGVLLGKLLQARLAANASASAS